MPSIDFAELLNVFETFLPQLLMYPNPADPLNGEAAALLMNSPDEYRLKVQGAFCPSEQAGGFLSVVPLVASLFGTTY